MFIFIPVIMGMGGACSTQTATVTLRSLALGRIGLGGIWHVVRKELLVGLVLAAATSVLVWSAAIMIDPQDTRVAWIAGLAVFGSICHGSFSGVLMPLMLDKIGVDPSVATNPLLSTLNDIIGSLLILAFCFFVLM